MHNKISIVSFVFIFSLIFISELSAQLTVQPSDTLTLISAPIMEQQLAYPDLQSIFLDTETNTASIMSIDKDHVYNTHFGFFCKQEAKRDKKSKVPVRMRLGTLDQVNRKEYGN